MKKTTPTTSTTTQSARPTRQDESAKTSSEPTGATPDGAAASTATGTENTTSPAGAKPANANAAADESKKGAALQIVTRFPADLGARLDRFTESLRNDRFGLRVSRADAVRILVHEALTAHEAKNEPRSTARSS